MWLSLFTLHQVNKHQQAGEGLYSNSNCCPIFFHGWLSEHLPGTSEWLTGLCQLSSRIHSTCPNQSRFKELQWVVVGQGHLKVILSDEARYCPTSFCMTKSFLSSDCILLSLISKVSEAYSTAGLMHALNTWLHATRDNAWSRLGKQEMEAGPWLNGYFIKKQPPYQTETKTTTVTK